MDQQQGLVFFLALKIGAATTTNKQTAPYVLTSIQAVTVANICDKSLDDKSRRIQHIETLMAFDLFCNYKFR